MNRNTLIISLILFTTFTPGCAPNDKSRKNHKSTTTVCDSLYAEKFSTFGQGAWGGDRDGLWLTDSTSFRIYLGVFDETDGGISVICKDDSIIVKQLPDNLEVNNTIKFPLIKTYFLKELKKLNNLNDY